MSYSLNIGPLDQRVTLQQPVVADDTLGQPVRTWVDVATVWAAVEPLRSRELQAASGRLAEATVRVRIRHRADVLATWRVVWRGTPMAIVGEPIDVRGARVALELMCATGAAAA